MRRDPTEFRLRFAAWKDGENYWDTRGEDIFPGYSRGKTGFYSTHRDRWRLFLISKGINAELADRLSTYFAALDSLESGNGTSSAARQKNNFGGMLRGGKNISYNTVQDYMNDKWNMMNKRFSRALNAKTVQEYATLINDPKYAGKGYLYAVADGYNQKNPLDRAWVARQILHMNNYTKAMMGIVGLKGFVARPMPKAPVVSKTEPIEKANPIPSAVELLEQNELPLILPESTITTQTPTQAAQQAQLSEYIQKPLVSEKVPVLGGDYWENYFNNNSLDQFQSLIQQLMTSHKHGKNILPRHKDGKIPVEYNEELVELPEVRVDDEGNVVQDGRKGSIRLPNVTIKPDHNVREAVDRYYDKLSRRSERAWYTNPITGESYMPKGGPLESVYPEFDLITLGQMSAPILKAAGKKFVQNRSYSLGRPTIPHEFSKPSPNKISIHEEGIIQPITPADKIADPWHTIIKPQHVTINQPYRIERYPGYMLKSLMEGNPLEKQLSKAGTISANSIRALANKASNVEKAIINKILSSEQFAGQKSIDYNRFRKAVQDELIEYKVTPDSKWDDYGFDRLGFRSEPVYELDDAVGRYNDIITRIHDFRLLHNIPSITRRSTPDDIAAKNAWMQTEEGRQWRDLQSEYDTFIREHPHFTTINLQSNPGRRLIGHKGDKVTLNTYTFSSDKIPIGNGKHYNANTLGHSRTYTTEDEPDVLHVMESLSDWGQAGGTIRQGKTRITPDMMEEVMGPEGPELQLNSKGRRILAEENPTPIQEQYLVKNYLQRQLQENLRYAAEKGLTKMRYPTPETAAKIEGYSPTYLPEDKDRAQLLEDIIFNRKLKNPYDLSESGFPIPTRDLHTEELEKELSILKSRKDYRPEHKTILKKYSDFPKQFKKLWKNQDVRTVTDKKGNSWYEVDVPKNFLNREWMYGMLPFIIGSSAYGLNEYKHGKNPIHINPANRGKFNALKKRTGKTTELLTHSKNPLTRKRAIFALNSRKFKH